MKILYYSDKYAYDVMGTKRSLAESIRNILGYEIIWVDKSKIVCVLELVKEHKPNQIWLAHSGLKLPAHTEKKIHIPVVGFGFSDPCYFSEGRLKRCDMYVTNHYNTLLKYKHLLPIFYNPVACDIRFHKRLNLKKDIDVSFIGCGRHPKFKNRTERPNLISFLRGELEGVIIKTFGRQWPEHPFHRNFIVGDKFLEAINRTKVGIDIQEEDSPLSHKMFEYLACGSFIVTRRRPEVERHLKENEHIVYYSSWQELSEKIEFYLGNPDLREKIATAGYEHVRTHHDITNRVNSWVKECVSYI